MYQHDWHVLKIVEERERDLLRTLEQDRLIREAEIINRPYRHRLYHVLDWLGRLLVHWGERLQARHAMRHHQALTHTLEGQS